MACPHCGSSVVAFVVPPPLRVHAPAEETAICTHCLRTSSAAAADAAAVDVETADFRSVDRAFPAGEPGAALALCCGLLESLAHNRAAVETLVEHAERGGVDVFGFLERLDAEAAPFDLARRRAALADLL
jgi:hypothetical protein